MKIRELMTRDVQIARPDDSLRDCAERMAAGDFGFLPVAENDRLIGTLTDRDIAVRAVAAGADPASPILPFVSRNPITAREDDDPRDVLHLMGGRQVRRLPVVDRDGRLVGVVSLGDLAVRVKEKYAGEALESVSRPA